MVTAAAAGPGRHAGAIRHARAADGARDAGDEQRRRVPLHVRHVLVPVERRPSRVHETVLALQPRAHRRGDRGVRRGDHSREPSVAQTVPRSGPLIVQHR